MQELNLTVGGPINTGNGNYSYRQSTPSIPTVGEPLQLEWTYNSLNSGAWSELPPSGSSLGLGWSHNYNPHLDLTEANRVTFRAAHGTPLYFERVKDSFRAAPGVWGTLTRTEVITGQYLYTLTAVNQARYVFTTTGQILRQIDPQGNAFEFSYDPQGRLSQVSEPTSGRALDFGYDANDRLATVTDPAGRTTSFGYQVVTNTLGQPLDLLTTITDTRNQVWDYDYVPLSGGQYLLAAVTDPDGHLVEATDFDDQGRAISQTYRGEYVGITYQDDGRRIISDGLGRVMTHTYSSQLLLAGTTDALGEGQTFALDEHYNRTYAQDKNGNPTYFERTDLGLTTAITDALGNVTRYAYDDNNNLRQSIDARGKVTSYLYDTQAHNNLISMTNHLGDGQFYTYNAQGQMTTTTDENDHTTRYGYDLIGQRTVITDALGHTTHFAYDSVGRVVTTTDALGQVTINEYDGDDNLVKVTENYLAGQSQNYQNEYNLITTYTYDGAGRRVTTTDTLGRVTRTEYDAAGRLLRTIRNEHPTISTQNYLNEYNLITAYDYDQAGNQIAVTDTLGRETRTEYDDLNRVERTIVNYVDGSYSSAAPDEDIITRYEYDPNGNLVNTFDTLDRETRTEYDDLNRVERTIVNYQNGVYSPANPAEDLITGYSYDEVGNQIAVTDPLGRQTGYSYDDLNRVQTITNPLSGTTTYGYDDAGNRVSVTDAENRTTTYAYDRLNRVVTTTNALNDPSFVYFDAVGNRTRTIDANGHAMTYTYDSLYRVTHTTDAANQTTGVTYDALSQRLTQTDPESRVTRYQYDSLNRLITTTLNYVQGGPGNTDTNVTTVVTYDALGNRTQVVDPRSKSMTYQYDELNRLVQTTDANNLTTTITYDGLGNRLSVTNAANETTEFEYDPVNRLVLTRDPLGHETEYRYNGVGNRLAMIDAENVETRYEYDDLDRLTGVIEHYLDGSFNPTFPDEDVKTEYDYDAVGNRLQVTDARSNSTTFAYDALNRRIELTDPLNHTTHYGYDAVGNRTVITDANGVVTTFAYDPVNRLSGIDYGDSTPDVSFTYDQVGNRLSMLDGTGTTTYTYDDLDRLTEVTDGANLTVGYNYDAVGNRTQLTYPNSYTVTYTYDDGNRLQTVTDWHNGQFGYNYDSANRLTGVTLPNEVISSYSYDDAGRLTLLTHDNITETLASYAYSLDAVGNRRVLTESLITIESLASGTYLENSGQVVMEAEHFTGRVTGVTHEWLLKTNQNGYTGTSYLQALPDLDTLYQTGPITAGPRAEYAVDFTTPNTYTVWLRGYPTNAAGDSVYVGLGDEQVEVTGFAPGIWSWVNTTTSGLTTTLSITTTGVHTVSLAMREDGVRIDRLLLTTDTTYIPTAAGPAETDRQLGTSELIIPLTRTIVYTYDHLYRLTAADYTSGQSYVYSYDPVGNRLQQIIDGDTTMYQYDAANRLEQLNGQSVYTFDNNGNLLNSDTLTNTWDAANRLIETERAGTTLEPIYNGVGDRVGQTTSVTTTYFALDVMGLPEVIYTTEGNLYLHLPGVIMAESGTGEIRYLLSDGLGSVRQATDESGEVVAYNEFDPYGNPVQDDSSPYGFTGEWWESDIGLLHLRARWYAPETGTFLSVDPVESEPPYQYVRGNVVNLIDPSGMNSLSASIGTLYDGEPQPLIDRITELHDGGWRIEENLFGNDLFKDGLVRFRDYILRIAVPDTTEPTESSQATIGLPLIRIAPSMYRTILYFQGLMDVASIGDDTTYRIGYPIPGNPEFARPGLPSEYINIQILPTGYAYFTGGKVTDDMAINGATPATTSLGQLMVLKEKRQRYPNGNPRSVIAYPELDPYEAEGFIGNTEAMSVVSAFNALDLVYGFINTPPIGLRSYQLLLQEYQLPVCGSGLRYRVLIQTYQLMVYPGAGMVDLRSAHLSVSPEGTLKETSFNSMQYWP